MFRTGPLLDEMAARIHPCENITARCFEYTKSENTSTTPSTTSTSASIIPHIQTLINLYG